MRDDRISAARTRARALQRQYGVCSIADIRIEAFVADHGIEVQYCELDGADAQLIRFGGRLVMLINTRSPEEKQRFSIAHELGHVVLEHPAHAVADLASRERYRSERRPGSPDYEAEANAFASELLMPRHLLGNACDVTPVDLEVPRRISRDYNVSILAGTVRFTELAAEPCAAVFSTKAGVEWRFTSASFRQALEPGRQLAPSSIAYRGFDKGAIDDRPHNVPACAWFNTRVDVEIVEHAIYSREYGTVLSMLWIPPASASALEKTST